ncbi:nucleoside recognition domain-containing protein [Niallia sp. NCCP-28]|uniref:nucleoside recognition domain-containing protein n=1 Tax=Niallia sp. NCCP-28 TaxID=2934712 RepID=UPI002085B3D6|nr:nucleoside recognition domain-containing protein [Niallia sp. NCCP-28]GKU80654.1 ferrous iron transporter B [Niallia sp. NCCP-28]
MLANQRIHHRNAVIIGFESSGKTTLFSRLSGKKMGDETNVKGSTVSISSTPFPYGFLSDTPGINHTDSQTQNIVKQEIKNASTIFLVVRGTHFIEELDKLYPFIEKTTKKLILFVTFSDKMPSEGKQLLSSQIIKKKLPIFIVDTRKLANNTIDLVLECVSEEDTIKDFQLKKLLSLPINKIDPPSLFFEKKYFGTILALLSLVAMFLIPVMLAYYFSNFIQPVVDAYFIDKVKSLFNSSPRIIQTIFIDDYGLLTLGIYSFIWAFPVVLLISCSKALTEETGLKDRIIDCIEPLIKKMGLTGRDIAPIIAGFGCNVVAVFQSRGCHSCSRSQCISFISFGSACSYQIGATLSIFNAAKAASLFFPYILLLLLGGIIHNRLWFDKQTFHEQNFNRKAFIQKPNLLSLTYRLKADLFQFLKQAMPIFMIICIVASLLQYLKIISFISIIFYPLLYLLHLPIEGAAALAFSIIRKDGILMINKGNGELFSVLSHFQLFLLVFLASTLTSCIVTLSTIWKELGLAQAWKFLYRQAITSILLGSILMIGHNVLHFL